MNRSCCFVIILGVLIHPIFAQNAKTQNHFAADNFIAGTIDAKSLDYIINAGVRAPSSNNLQPWHFTIVKDPGLTTRIINSALNGNIVIVVSAPEEGVKNGWDVLDCGLALQSMYLAAQEIGLGSRIYTGPHRDNASKLKKELGIPGNYTVVATLRVGKVTAATDAISTASPRKPADKLINYK